MLIKSLFTIIFIYALSININYRVHAADVEADVGITIGPARRAALGFEWILPQAIDVDTLRPFVQALQPFVIKDPWGRPEVARSLGAQTIQWLIGNAVIAQGWYPWEDWNRWEEYVRQTVTTRTSGPKQAEWIIWQEPDNAQDHVWKGTQEQFFETWKRAVQIIRLQRPDDAIIGPSTMHFKEAYLMDFLLYAKEHHVLPDVLSWHELLDIGVWGFSPPHIVDHVSTMKSFMQMNGINIQRINITEYQGHTDNYRPGITAHFLANIERAKIEGTKGNWGSEDAYTLSGLLTSRTDPQPRSIWWAYKSYADITGQLAKVTLASGIDGVVGIDNNAKEIRAVFGNIGAPGLKTLRINNIPDFMLTNGEIALETNSIPNTEMGALPQPVRIFRYNAKPDNGSILINLTQFGTWDAYSVRLWKPPDISAPDDINQDGVVNGNDLNILIAEFGKILEPASNPADCNRNGRVDIFDMNILLSRYGKPLKSL